MASTRSKDERSFRSRHVLCEAPVSAWLQRSAVVVALSFVAGVTVLL
jgi:hypothetical protein